LLLAAALPAACDSRTDKAQAKRAEDAMLLALPYPTSTGARPATMEVTYDAASGRTSMTMRLDGLRATGRRAAGVGGATLHLTSSHKGRVRGPDDPEGSVDGSFEVRTSTPGVLAYSGPPGTATADGRAAPLRPPKSGEAYSSAGREESVRFRWPTEDLVRAANSGAVSMTFGGIEVELSRAHLADLREFAARLNPRP
jgi:hypothetical protein